MKKDVASMYQPVSLDAHAAEACVRLNPIAERRGKIVWITLARPEKANALNSESLTLLTEAIDLAEKEGEAEAAILSGSGANFCAGADLNELMSDGSASVRKLLTLFRQATHRIEQSSLAIIAAVHGAARAGGLEIALACDLILAGKSASFGDAHLGKGLLPGGGSTVRLPRAIGWQRSKWMILSAESISAERAMDWGLVHDVVEDDALLEKAEMLASRFVRGDQLSMQRAKRLISMVGEQPVSAALEAEIVTLEAHCHSESFKRGVGGFLSRQTAD